MKVMANKMLWSGISCLVVVNLFLGVGSVAQADTFTSFDFPDAVLTTGLGINAVGDIVGRYVDASNASHGYRRSGKVYTSIDFPLATFTVSSAINSQGDIVGFYTLPTG